MTWPTTRDFGHHRDERLSAGSAAGGTQRIMCRSPRGSNGGGEPEQNSGDDRNAEGEQQNSRIRRRAHGNPRATLAHKCNQNACCRESNCEPQKATRQPTAREFRSGFAGRSATGLIQARAGWRFPVGAWLPAPTGNSRDWRRQSTAPAQPLPSEPIGILYTRPADTRPRAWRESAAHPRVRSPAAAREQVLCLHWRESQHEPAG